MNKLGIGAEAKAQQAKDAKAAEAIVAAEAKDAKAAAKATGPVMAVAPADPFAAAEQLKAVGE